MDKKDIIKSEALELLNQGFSAKDVNGRLYLKYGKKQNLSKREFDNKYGRFIRRNVEKTSSTSSVKSTKVISFPQGGNDIITKDGKIVPLNEHIKEQRKDGSYNLEINNAPAMTRDDKAILKQFNLDNEKFEVSSFRESEWDAQTKRGLKQLHSYRVNVVPKKLNIEDTLEHLKETLKTMPELTLPASRLDKAGDEIAIVCIPDLHLGKWADDFVCPKAVNSQKITQAYRQIISDTVSILKLRPVEKILFYWSNDFFHYDNKQKTTTKGTAQDTDLAPQHMFTLGVNLLVEGITALSEVAPVKTFYTMSNHDELTGAHAAETLKWAFRENPNVEIDDDAKPRHYERYGINLFGFAHGDKEGKRINGLMQLEDAQDWGETKYREFLLGHFHSLKLSEENGIVFRYMQSPTAADDWHTTSGYLGAWQCGTVLIRNKYYGPVLDMPLMVLEDRVEGREKIYSSPLAA